MRNFVFAALCLALVGFAAPAAGQMRPFTIGIAGGPSIPTGDLADEAGTGYHVQGSIGFQLPLLPFGLRADAFWQEVPDEHEGFFRQVGGLLNATVGIPLIIARPYLLAGVGVLNTEGPDVVHADHTHTTEGQNSTGFHAGAGVMFPFVGLTGVVEARVLNLIGGDDAGRTIPITFGIQF